MLNLFQQRLDVVRHLTGVIRLLNVGIQMKLDWGTTPIKCDIGKNNPYHIYEVHKGMLDSDSILDELEFDNERWVSRTIHIKGIKYVEISKLYFCELCLNWCRTKTNIRLPIMVFNSLIKRYS